MSAVPSSNPLVPVEEHRARILAQVPVLAAETVPLLQAQGRVLAEDVASDEDLPPFDNSAVDGFAVRAADLAGASREHPRSLRVREHLPAGVVAKEPVAAGFAARIMTGAPVPPGADAVVMIEVTDGGSPEVTVYKSAAPGDNVRPRGESVRAGDMVLARGSVIGPAELSMLASLGRSAARVIRTPRVALFSTGDELVPLGTAPGPGQIRDSNRYGLIAQVAELGATPIDLGLVGDDEPRLRALVARGLAEADCLVTSGGVSVGDYDLTKRILGELGSIAAYRVAMKPGMPQVFGMTPGGKPVFGLPGNPVSSLVVFDQFVRPALLKMAGHRQVTRPRLLAVAAEGMRKPAGKTHFVRAVVENVDGVLHVRPTGPQGSGILRSLVLANALMILDQDLESIAAGDQVPVELLSPGVV
jgi:molybdopterin molybdotransferase